MVEDEEDRVGDRSKSDSDGVKEMTAKSAKFGEILAKAPKLSSKTG